MGQCIFNALSQSVQAWARWVERKRKYLIAIAIPRNVVLDALAQCYTVDHLKWTRFGNTWIGFGICWFFVCLPHLNMYHGAKTMIIRTQQPDIDCCFAVHFNVLRRHSPACGSIVSVLYIVSLAGDSNERIENLCNFHHSMCTSCCRSGR